MVKRSFTRKNRKGRKHRKSRRVSHGGTKTKTNNYANRVGESHNKGIPPFRDGEKPLNLNNPKQNLGDDFIKNMQKSYNININR